MADISKITLPSGAEYNLKDAWAREQIEQIAGLDTVTFKGVSSTVLTDGGNEDPTVDGVPVTTKEVGDLYFYGTTEFVYGDDNAWHALGDLTTLGDLAYADTASVDYTPAGTIAAPTFTGTEAPVAVTATADANGNYTPGGNITGGAFTGSNTTFSGSYTPAGTVTTVVDESSTAAPTVSPVDGAATYTPAGSVAAPAFTGTEATIEGSGSYTPEGSVAAPTISVATAGATDTIHNPAAVTVATAVTAAAPGATAPDNNLTYYSVSNETLNLYQLGFTTGDSITTTDVTVKTGDAAYTASAPAFTGTAATIETEATYTPAGTNAAPTFTGTGVRLATADITIPTAFTSTFAGTAATIQTSGTPEGSNAALTFTGTPVQLAGTTTAVGTVAQPVFTGTEATITVQPD